MALIAKGITCPLCGEVIDIDDEDRMVATTHFIEQEDDPLWPYSDAAMHKTCFLRWDRRQEFVDRYNELAGWLTHMESDGSHTEGDPGHPLMPEYLKPSWWCFWKKDRRIIGC